MTLYFYDLETSGISARTQRVMQFAGQRTDMDLNPIGEPDNIVIRLSDDIVPEPMAILITGITPQKTVEEGITEAEFLRHFADNIATPDTVMMGFNTVRFDDEFMRFMLYRNFYDPYEWQWADNRSRWDLLDVTRMTRALRPDGINWPVDDEGKSTNRLELLTKFNGLDHQQAHDALNDVLATIAFAKLVKQKQPKLFEYLFDMRTKQKVQELVQSGKPFLYSSGKYPGEYEKTTVVAVVAPHPNRGGALVFDLRHNPKEYEGLSAEELVNVWEWNSDRSAKRLPIKTLQFNRCPAVAPLSVLDAPSQKRLGLDLKVINANLASLKSMKGWPDLVLEALDIMDEKQQARFLNSDQTVDERLYDGFLNNQDKQGMGVVRAASPDELGNLDLKFKDPRLVQLLPLYKARNFKDHLTPEEREAWEAHRSHQLLGGKESSRLAQFFKQLEELQTKTDLTDNQKYLLEELQLYGQSIIPEQD